MILGYSQDLTKQMTDLLVMNLNSTGQSIPDENIEQIAASLFKIIPLVQPATWVFVFVGNIYIAIKITQKSGSFARPDDDWRRALRMPGMMLPIFYVGVFGMLFFDGNIGAAAAALTGAIGAGYVIAGLGATHLRLADNPGKGILLFGLYLALCVSTIGFHFSHYRTF